MNCIFCKSADVEKFLDLGFIPLVDRFLDAKELNEPEILYPLNVCLCKNCGLSQLGYKVPPTKLFNENYAYESSTTKTRKQNYDQLAEYICDKFEIPKESLIVDIGSNVGILLESFNKRGMKIVGVDASPNIVEIANSRGIPTISGFFDKNIVEKIVSEGQKASVVTGTNVFAHIQDYESFMDALTELLEKNGIFVFHVPHFLQLIRNLEYDTVYHEHVSYFGLKPLKKFFERFDMEIFDVSETDLDGGSIRCFVCRRGQKTISPKINKLVDEEEKEGIYSIERLRKFATETSQQKSTLLSLLHSLKKNNKRIVGIGAPAKGITLLNYCKIDNFLLDYVTEKAPLKIGKFTPGTHIPVKPDEVLMKDMPDYALILAWNFSKEIMKNLDEYGKSGGKFIIPIPNPQIV